MPDHDMPLFLLPLAAQAALAIGLIPRAPALPLVLRSTRRATAGGVGSIGVPMGATAEPR